MLWVNLVGNEGNTFDFRSEGKVKVVAEIFGEREVEYTDWYINDDNELIIGETDIFDHDDEVSVLEAFLSASAKVGEFYESESRIATEHAPIDDNGDGKGTPSSMRNVDKPSQMSAWTS